VTVKTEFSDWLRHPVTMVVMAELKGRYEQLKEQFVDQAATSSPTELAEKAGIAKGYRDILNISADELLEESHGN
jgi:hypothetical protein